MKIFERDGKINFVDTHNVFVGFDYTQDCCESFGYFFSTDVPDRIHEYNDDPFKKSIRIELTEDQLSHYSFNKKFINISGTGEDDNFATFKLICSKYKELNLKRIVYLTIYNCHNGYYGHGFEFGKVNGEIWHSKTL